MSSVWCRSTSSNAVRVKTITAPTFEHSTASFSNGGGKPALSRQFVKRMSELRTILTFIHPSLKSLVPSSHTSNNRVTLSSCCNNCMLLRSNNLSNRHFAPCESLCYLLPL